MLKRFAISAAVLGLLFVIATRSALAAPAPRPEKPAKGPKPNAAELPVGYAHNNPVPSPHGFYLRGSHGFGFAVNVEPDRSGRRGTVRVEAGYSEDAVTYSAQGNLAGEGIHVDLGRFGRIDLRWKPNGKVKERHRRCGHVSQGVFFDDGSYVGTVRLRGGNGFTSATAHRIRWSRSWYGPHTGCPFSVSEGFPGPGAILIAARGAHRVHEADLFVVQNGAGARVEYDAHQTEKVGRIEVSRFVALSGGPKTITVGPGFRTGAITPPAPFSGTGRFERTKGARGTWLGDLSVEFVDGTDVRFAGTAYEAVFHSGYYEVHEGF